MASDKVYHKHHNVEINLHQPTHCTRDVGSLAISTMAPPVTVHSFEGGRTQIRCYRPTTNVSGAALGWSKHDQAQWKKMVRSLTNALTKYDNESTAGKLFLEPPCQRQWSKNKLFVLVSNKTSGLNRPFKSHREGISAFSKLITMNNTGIWFHRQSQVSASTFPLSSPT